MDFDNRLVAAKLDHWKQYLGEFHLPAWEELPNLGLYMEQVLLLMNGYLDYLPPDLKDEGSITAATINNYVRKKVMPKPEGKRYYRIHLAYLVIICTLKQSLSINTIQSMLPSHLEEGELEAIYSSFRDRHELACRYFVSQAEMLAAGILENGNGTEISTSDPGELISFSALLGAFSTLLAEKLIQLDGAKLEDLEDVD